MKTYRFFTIGFLMILLSYYSFANAMEEKPKPLKIDKINTNYPLKQHVINLPDDSTNLKIQVDAKEATTVRFYFDTTESEMGDTKQLIKEDSNPRDGFNCVMDYDPSEGFARQIIVEAVAKNGITKTKRFNVYKSIDSSYNS